MEKVIFGNVENGFPVIKECSIATIVDTILKRNFNRKRLCAVSVYKPTKRAVARDFIHLQQPLIVSRKGSRVIAAA